MEYFIKKELEKIKKEKRDVYIELMEELDSDNPDSETIDEGLELLEIFKDIEEDTLEPLLHLRTALELKLSSVEGIKNLLYQKFKQANDKLKRIQSRLEKLDEFIIENAETEEIGNFRLKVRNYPKVVVLDFKKVQKNVMEGFFPVSVLRIKEEPNLRELKRYTDLMPSDESGIELRDNKKLKIEIREEDYGI